jgi:hypothetical protein
VLIKLSDISERFALAGNMLSESISPIERPETAYILLGGGAGESASNPSPLSNAGESFSNPAPFVECDLG